MSRIHQLAALGQYGPGWELYWEHDRAQVGDGAEHGEIVVRVRPESVGLGQDHGHEVCRLGWPTHLHRPAEPLHESLVQLIGESLVSAIRDAHQAGRDAAMEDVRRLIGAERACGHGVKRW